MEKWTLRRAHPEDAPGIIFCTDVDHAVNATRITGL